MTCECYGNGVCRACKAESALDRVASLEAENARLREQLAEAQADQSRFEWWFSPALKVLDITTYLRGVREGWHLNQWRAYVDAERMRADVKEGNKR